MGCFFSRDSKNKAGNKRQLRQQFRQSGVRIACNQPTVIMIKSYEEMNRGQGASTAVDIDWDEKDGFPKLTVYDGVGLPPFPIRQKAYENKNTGANGKPLNPTGKSPMGEKKTGLFTHFGKSGEETYPSIQCQKVYLEDVLRDDFLGLGQFRDILLELVSPPNSATDTPPLSQHGSIIAIPRAKIQGFAEKNRDGPDRNRTDWRNHLSTAEVDNQMGANSIIDPLGSMSDANTKFKLIMKELDEIQNNFIQKIDRVKGRLPSHAFQNSLNRESMKGMPNVCPPLANEPLFDQNRVFDPVVSRECPSHTTVPIMNGFGAPSFPVRQKASENKDTGADEKLRNPIGKTPMREKKTGSDTHYGKSGKQSSNIYPRLGDIVQMKDVFDLFGQEEFRAASGIISPQRLAQDPASPRSQRGSLTVNSRANIQGFDKNRVNDPVMPGKCPLDTAIPLMNQSTFPQCKVTPIGQQKMNIWDSDVPLIDQFEAITESFEGNKSISKLCTANIGVFGDNSVFAKSDIVYEKAAIPKNSGGQIEDDGSETDD